MNKPYISVVIPVYNEEPVLQKLFDRLMPVMDAMAKSYEIIFVDDGSKDRSEAILKEFHQQRPQNIRIIHFNGNFGQHLAVMAGLEKVRGEIIVTLDADLQNAPEDIPNLVKTMEEGYDVVSGFRQNRQDKTWRKFFSKIHNVLRAKIIPRLVTKDQGCMLRAYRRNIIELVVSSGESNTYIPALALHYAANPAEIPVSHEMRWAGESKYNFYKLIRNNFDLIANFSLVPLQMFTLLGIAVSMMSALLVVYILLRRLVIGPEAEGIFTLFAILFFLVGLCLLGLGILGEYIGRIYQEVRRRPRFVIRNVLEHPEESVNES